MNRMSAKFLFILILVLAIVALMGCAVEDLAGEAVIRIENAINSIDVRADGTNARLEDFRQGDTRTYSDILVYMDFRRMLAGVVEKDDFFIAKDHLKPTIDRLYEDLSYMFTNTDNLTIRAVNSDYINEENYDVPDDMRDLKEIEIEIGRFIKSSDKYLRLEAEFGSLDMYSEFFYGKSSTGASGNIEGHKLRFGYEGGELDGESVIVLTMLDRRNTETDSQNPGKSFLITIPLDADFMRDSQGDLKYDAVEYIDQDAEVRGVLPRSFIDGDNLYIYANRTGRFRLVKTENGNTHNKELFLRDRGITISSVTDLNGNTVQVSRGEMYIALMDIHWVENLFHDLTPVPQLLPDVPTGGRLEEAVKIGQNLKAFPLTGYEDRMFRATNALWFSHLYDIVAGYTEAFGIDIDGLLPANPNAIGVPSDFGAFWWSGTFEHLMKKGFVPYRYDAAGNAYVLPDEPLTLEEAYDILYLLITTRHFTHR